MKHKILILIAATFVFPLVTYAQFPRATCEVQPLWC
jgi:hypothetical protein